MTTYIVLLGLGFAFNVNAKTVIIDSVKPVVARQQTLAEYVTASLTMVAYSFGVPISHAELALSAPAFLHSDNTSFQKITTYLNGAWHSTDSRRIWMTNALSFEHGSVPASIFLTSLRAGHPVLLAYSGVDFDDMVVAIGAELDESLQPGSLPSITSIIVLDPRDGQQSVRNWKLLKPLLIGSWLPMSVLARDCGAISAAFLFPECAAGLRNGQTPLLVFPPESRQPSQRPTCMDFTGAWETPKHDMSVMVLSQNPQCFLSGSYRSRSADVYDYFISGRSYRDEAIILIHRESPGGCKATISGKMVYRTSDVLLVTTPSTDGRCDLPVKLEEQRIWIRQQE